MNLRVKILVLSGSFASIGFGIWHFFVPEIWKWYSYIDVNATELVAAVRAINVFFSLALVLFGVVNILFIYGDKSNRYSIIVMLSATSILWITRVVISNYLSARFNQPYSPIRNAISIHNRVTMLHNFSIYYSVVRSYANQASINQIQDATFYVPRLS